MDEAVQVFSRHTFRSFAGPSEEDADWDAWYGAEKACREKCEQAIHQWMISKSFPLLDDDEAYFLCHRFTYVSQFLQKLFLRNQSSVFSHEGFSLTDVLWWALVDWWEEHGVYDAFWEDFEREEQAYNSSKKQTP